MNTIQKEVADAILNAIEDVMDRYEDRQFVTDVVGVQDGLVTKIIKFEIDGEDMTVIIQ